MPKSRLERSEVQARPMATPPRISISIDIGSVNMGIYIGMLDVDRALVKTLEVEVVKVAVEDPSKPKKKLLTREGFMKITEVLHSRYEYILQCDEVVIEQQIQNKIVRASNNVRMEQHVQSYFDTINAINGTSIKVYVVNPSDKYRLLRGPLGESKAMRKAWSPVEACRLLEAHAIDEKNERDFTRFIKSIAQAEHVGDCIVQLFAHWLKIGLIQIG